MGMLLDIRDLKVYYSTLRGSVKAVDGISFSIGKGRSYGLVGESGCGKTTVALAITRLLPPNGEVVGGEIRYNGIDLLSMREEELKRKIRWKKISIVFQGSLNALNPVFTVGDQIAEAILLHEDVDKEEARQRAMELLSLVRIPTERVDYYPHELSGGQRQRVMIAMALACNPEFTIFDEPTTALDVITQAQILELIKDLQERLKLTTMLITHDLAVVAELCDEVGVMYAGKLVESGEIEEIYESPLHPYTEFLVRTFPSIRGRKEFVEVPGSPPNLLNPPRGCRFHPRCPYAMEICKKEEPEYVKVEKGRFVSCHRVSRR